MCLFGWPDRKFHWLAGLRPADHGGLTELGLWRERGANMTSERKVVVITGAVAQRQHHSWNARIHHDQYDIDGIRVERFTTAPKDAAQRPPLGSACMVVATHRGAGRNMPCLYAAAEREVHALNWRGRGGSAATAPMTRS